MAHLAGVEVPQSEQLDGNEDALASESPPTDGKQDKKDGSYHEPSPDSLDHRNSQSKKQGKPNASKANQQAAGLLARLLDNLDDNLPAFRTFKRNAITRIFKQTSPTELQSLREAWLEKEVKPAYVATLAKLPFKEF